MFELCSKTLPIFVAILLGFFVCALVIVYYGLPHRWRRWRLLRERREWGDEEAK